MNFYFTLMSVMKRSYIYIYIYVCGETCFNKWKLSEMIIKRKKQGVIISLLFSVPIHVG